MLNIEMSYYEMLEEMSMGNNLENGKYLCTDGIMTIDGECGEEIDFIQI